MKVITIQYSGEMQPKNIIKLIVFYDFPNRCKMQSNHTIKNLHHDLLKISKKYEIYNMV